MRDNGTEPTYPPKLFNTVKQRQLEDWSNAYLSKSRDSKTANWGATVRAAIEAGWLANSEYTPAKNGTPESWKHNGVDVDELDGWQVRQVADWIDEKYEEATTIPKN